MTKKLDLSGNIANVIRSKSVTKNTKTSSTMKTTSRNTINNYTTSPSTNH
jgi:hypothetical protein